MQRRPSFRFATTSLVALSALLGGVIAIACDGDGDGDDAPADGGGGVAGGGGRAGSSQGCGAGGVCLGSCQIGGAVVTQGALDPANACAQCDAARARDAWSPRPDGTTCGAGQVCGAGACGARCFIAGVLYAADAANPADACERCAPATSTTAWSALASGAVCGAGTICEAGECHAACFIDGVFYPADATNPADACQQCSPATSTSAWSPRAAVTLLAGGTDVAAQGWSIASQAPFSLTNGPDYVRVATSTSPGANTSGQLLLYYPGAYELGKPFTIRVEALVESVTPHNALDSGAALLGAYTPPFGSGPERAQMVYLDAAAVGWADDSQPAAPTTLNEYHAYELSVDADGVARLRVDGVAALTRNGFAANGTIALGDQTNDVGVDGAMRIRSVSRACP